MDPNTNPPAPPLDPPAPPPAAPPAPPAAPVPPAVPPATMEQGGKTGFFDGITWVDVGMFALVSLALYYSIYASRTQIKNLNTVSGNQQKQLDDLKAQLQELTTPKGYGMGG